MTAEMYSLNSLIPRSIDEPYKVSLIDTDFVSMDDAKIFAGPSNPSDRDKWRSVLEQWRADAMSRHDYSREIYENPDAAWMSSCFAVAQVWLWDELLYSFSEGRFTPERFLEDAEERFGGLDAIVLWHAYPVIGIDERNQWDYYRQVPGIKDLVAEFHHRGVRVFVDYNPWDVGTRRGGTDVRELCDLVKDLEADGVFLDTLKKAQPEFVAALEEARPGLILEGESKLAVERIGDHGASWAQFFADSQVPGVLRSHWYERAHMQHHVRRWHRDHSDELQSAWINGVGIMIWEVVFGAWVGWSKRDAATVKRMLTIQRAASSLLQNGAWEPLTRLSIEAEKADVYASAWEKDGVKLWTVVNRSSTDYLGPVLDSRDESYQYLALGEADNSDGGGAGFSIFVPSRSIAAIVAWPKNTSCPAWIARSHDQLVGVAPNGDKSFPHRFAKRVEEAHCEAVRLNDIPVATSLIPAGSYSLTVRYRARETGMYQGAPYVDEWKPLPPRLHDPRTLQRQFSSEEPVAVADREVTNREFADFVKQTGYCPENSHRYLANWSGGAPAEGHEDEPVVFVDLDDARAYCQWVGGRLPTEDEWQLAAESPGFDYGIPRVWNWTASEHSDGRSRFVMIKGGADYRAEGSEWYIEGGPHSPEYAVKLLLGGLGTSRSSTIGFRVAWDVLLEGETDVD